MIALTWSKIQCQSCGHAWESGTVEEKFGFTTEIPPLNSSKSGGRSVSFTECVDAYSDPDSVEVHCDSCGKTSEALKWMQLRDLGPYVLVNLHRVLIHGGKPLRNRVPVSLPSSGVTNIEDGEEDVRYEAIGHVNHIGQLNYGHWTCWTNVQDQWWHCDDGKVAKRDAKGRSKGSGSVICTVVLKRSA